MNNMETDESKNHENKGIENIIIEDDINMNTDIIIDPMNINKLIMEEIIEYEEIYDGYTTFNDEEAFQPTPLCNEEGELVFLPVLSTKTNKPLKPRKLKPLKQKMRVTKIGMALQKYDEEKVINHYLGKMDQKCSVCNPLYFIFNNNKLIVCFSV